MTKRIFQPEVYNMHYHDLSVAIYQWAEFQVTQPWNNSNNEYAETKLREALDTCRAEGLIWFPNAETYKGKSQKYIGYITVEVVMPNGQSYGFRHYKDNAEKIMQILDDLYKKFIHGDQP